MSRLAVGSLLIWAFFLTVPVYAQPFADVPANHWAYDAIAKLAAKGLVVGYPDGTFKGDGAMTRYEMAMVIARLMAQLESTRISAPGSPPQVTRADLEALQRLVSEFRAELAALKVRTTAIEEELNKIKSGLDTVKITGFWRFRYDDNVSASTPNGGAGTAVCGTSCLNGNENTGSTDPGTSPNYFRARIGGKLKFDASVAPDIHAILGLELGTGLTSTPAVFDGAGYGPGPGGLGCTGGNSPTGTFCGQLVNIAELYLDWKHALGLPIRIELGRMGTIMALFGSESLVFGPHGLLLNTTSHTYSASNGNSGTNIWDGLRLSSPERPATKWDRDLMWQAAIWRVVGPTDGGTYFLGEDAYGFDASIGIVPGIRNGGYWVANNINGASPVFPSNANSALWHVYGNPFPQLTNPPTANCPAAPNGTLPAAAGGGVSQGGIRCPALGSGVGGYVTWDLVPGEIIGQKYVSKVRLDAEVATWNDGTTGRSDSARYIALVYDLGTRIDEDDTSRNHAQTVTLAYEYAGVNFYAPYQNDVDDMIAGSVGPGNAELYTVDVSLDIGHEWSFLAAYIFGSNVSNGMRITEWRGGLRYRFAPRATIYFRVENQQIAGVNQYTLYRSELDYRF